MIHVNLPDKLKEHFSSYGKVVEHQIMLDHSTGRSRGFGFVTFESEDAVERVMSEGRMQDLGGKQVTLFLLILCFSMVSPPFLLNIKIRSSSACSRKNSCARTLIFGSSSFIAFLSKFFSPLFIFLLSVLLHFLLFLVWFLSSFVFPLFSSLFCPCFFGSCGFISSLPQLAWD
jgi:hypothetical protein